MQSTGFAKNARWKLLMQSLYYPAVLGTCFVLVLNKLMTHRSITAALLDVTVYAGLLFTFYFTISYLVNNEVESGAYGVGAFTIDLVEIVLIFLAFAALGYLEPQRPEIVDLRRCYAYIAAIPILEQLWNRLVGTSDIRLWWISGCASGLSIFGAVAAFRWPIFNAVALMVFFILMVVYLSVLVKE
jgi:hypothetical protein